MKLLNIPGLSLPYPAAGLAKKQCIKKIFLKCFFVTISIIFFSPLLSAESVKQKEKPFDWFWFFYEHTVSQNESSYLYRPFYMERSDRGNLFQASVMPVFFWRYKDERKDVTKGFFGLYASDDYQHPGKEKDYDNGCLPLFFYGDGDKTADRYLFIYPLGGDIRGKMAYDRISPYVFPGVVLWFLFPPAGLLTWHTTFLALASIIPVYTEFEDKDYRGTALFWPFIAWGKSGSREDFRIIPFYGHNVKPGWYDNYSYLFIINYRELYLSDDVKYTFFFFPLFGKRWSKSEKIKSYTVLWPFFSWGYDLDKNERIYNLPWPLVQIGDSGKPETKTRIFWPFYGKHETPSYQSMFVTPLYFRIKNTKDYFKSEYHITCIVAWYLKRDYSRKHEYYGRSWRYFKLWPLVQVEWNDTGLYGINVLSLLPFRDVEGYEKLYQPFWTLFEYRERPDGEKHLGFLLRTYYQVWNDDFFKMKIPLIVNYEKRGDIIKEFTVLLRSFGYEKDKDGTYLKFLWIPLKIGDGDILLSGDRDDTGHDTDDPLSHAERYGYNPVHGNPRDTGLEGKFYFKSDIKL